MSKFSKLKLLSIILLGSASILTVSASNWYVDNEADGAETGKNWYDAWNGFGNIEWNQIKPGDTLFISGGNVTKTYNEQLRIGSSGNPGNEIVIQPGKEDQHAGKVVISNKGGWGIFFPGKEYVLINGNENCNIVVKDCISDGILVYGASHHVRLYSLEVSNNGSKRGHNGIYLNYSSNIENEDLILEIAYCKIHDNYQDQIRIMGTRGPNKFGRIKIHSNEIYGLHDDGIECGVRGLDFYHNKMHTFNGHKSSGDHPDGIVTAAGYCRVFSNKLINLCKEGGIFGNNLYVGLYSPTPIVEKCIYYYDNTVISCTYSSGNDWGNKGLEFSTKANNNIIAVEDVMIAFNTFVGMPGLGLSISFGLLDSSKIKNVKIFNNIVYNCGRDVYGAIMLQNNTGDPLGIGSDQTSNIMFDCNILNKGVAGSDIVKYHNDYFNYEDFKNLIGCHNDKTAIIDYQIPFIN